MKSVFKFIFDWMFITNYRYTFLKNKNPEFKVIVFTSFIFTNFIIFCVNLTFISFEIKAIKPYWFVIVWMLMYLINYIYYFNLNKKNDINVLPKKNDVFLLYIIFFLSAFLNFYTYYYLIEHINN
ncbi:MAG: hypothetical protein B7Y83_06685 [Flavobacteriales bacterium 32-34-25]|nr:MAG: hypothetical protein B7Y83_06685 [Flavobacteriales bacterium 32-34-25]